MNRPCVLLADDNSEIRHLARRLLSEEFTVAASVGDGSSVLHKVPTVRPDLIILDISMGEPNGIEVARRLRKSGCSAKILFLTVHQTRDYVDAAIDAGACAYVIKSRLGTDLLPAVKAACSGRVFLSHPLSVEHKGDIPT